MKKTPIMSTSDFEVKSFCCIYSKPDNNIMVTCQNNVTFENITAKSFDLATESSHE
jgi:hypothetical protein